MINVVLFLGIYVFGVGVAIFRNPAIIFVVYQIVYFFNPQNRWWGYMIPDVSYSFYVVAIMGLLFGLSFTKKDKVKSPIPSPMRWMFAIVVICVLASFYAVFPEAHSSFVNNFVKLAVTMTLAYKLCNKEQHLDYILAGFIIGAAYIGYVAHQVGRNASGGRVEGIGMVDSPDANGTAAAIAPAIVLCLYYVWVNRKLWSKFIVCIAAAFIANAIVLINSRGAFLGVAVSVGYFMLNMYFSSFQRKYQKGAAVILTILGLSAALVLVDDSFIERIHSIFQTDIEDTSRETGATRTQFWWASVSMSLDYPLGQGYKGFNFYAPEYIPVEVDTGGSRNRSVHSTWFQALSEVGYPGLFALIMMLVSSHFLAGKTKKYLAESQRIDEYFKVIALQSALFCYVVAMTFLNRLTAEVLYWCILFICVAYNVYVQQPRMLEDKKDGDGINLKSGLNFA